MKNKFSKELLNWYYSNNREMPWRGESDVYKIWLSEVMLQQTQVKTVIPYYKKWLKKFPTIASVALANEDEILKMWEGLGYYARARNFKSACEWIYINNKGKMPAVSSEFRNLKGVGDYIHAAVRSIAYNEIIPVIDGNVKRVVSRVLEIKTVPSKSLDIMKVFLENHISIDNPGDFNQAMMDLGSTICKPKQPKCINCNINSFCKSHINNTVNLYPLPEKKRIIPKYNIAVGVIWRDNDILVSKRHSNVMLGGLWEFPGGKIKMDESPQDCVKREIDEELGIIVSVGDKIKTINHAYTHFKIKMTAFHCQYVNGNPKAIDCADFKWIKTTRLHLLPFPKANHKIFNLIPEINPCSS